MRAKMRRTSVLFQRFIDELVLSELYFIAALLFAGPFLSLPLYCLLGSLMSETYPWPGMYDRIIVFYAWWCQFGLLVLAMTLRRRRLNRRFPPVLRVIKLQAERSRIPHGPYCYETTGRMITMDQVFDGGRLRKTAPYKIPEMKLCPFWSRVSYPRGPVGYCSYLNKSDTDLDCGLLWDAVKECGVNDDLKEAYNAG